LPGAYLRSKGLNRIGNLLVPNDNYCKFEDWIIPIFDQMLREQNNEVFYFILLLCYKFYIVRFLSMLGVTFRGHAKCCRIHLFCWKKNLWWRRFLFKSSFETIFPVISSSCFSRMYCGHHPS
jgi:hypothetical protein